MSQLQLEQVRVEPSPSAINVTLTHLLLSAVLPEAQHPGSTATAAIDRYLHAGYWVVNSPAAAAAVDWWDRQTPDHYTDNTLCTLCAKCSIYVWHNIHVQVPTSTCAAARSLAGYLLSATRDRQWRTQEGVKTPSILDRQEFFHHVILPTSSLHSRVMLQTLHCIINVHSRSHHHEFTHSSLTNKSIKPPKFHQNQSF